MGVSNDVADEVVEALARALHRPRVQHRYSRARCAWEICCVRRRKVKERGPKMCILRVCRRRRRCLSYRQVVRCLRARIGLLTAWMEEMENLGRKLCIAQISHHHRKSADYQSVPQHAQ